MVDWQASHFIFFPGRVKKSALHNFQLFFHDSVIEQANSAKYLGLWIDKDLNFETHISHVTRKVLPMIYAIKRVREKVSQQILNQLYFSHVYSHLIFMNPVWSAATNETKNKLFVLQKKVLRFIQFKDRLSPSRDLFSQKFLPLPVISEFYLLLLAFKVKNNMIKNNVVLQYVENIHRYGTRQSHSFYVFMHETRFGIADFYKRGLIKFNELTHDLRSIQSLGNFKNKLREHLFGEFMGVSGVWAYSVYSHLFIFA